MGTDFFELFGHGVHFGNLIVILNLKLWNCYINIPRRFPNIASLLNSCSSDLESESFFFKYFDLLFFFHFANFPGSMQFFLEFLKTLKNNCRFETTRLGILQTVRLTQTRV